MAGEHLERGLMSPALTIFLRRAMSAVTHLLLAGVAAATVLGGEATARYGQPDQIARPGREDAVQPPQTGLSLRSDARGFSFGATAATRGERWSLGVSLVRHQVSWRDPDLYIQREPTGLSGLDLTLVLGGLSFRDPLGDACHQRGIKNDDCFPGNLPEDDQDRYARASSGLLGPRTFVLVSAGIGFQQLTYRDASVGFMPQGDGFLGFRGRIGIGSFLSKQTLLGLSAGFQRLGSAPGRLSLCVPGDATSPSAVYTCRDAYLGPFQRTDVVDLRLEWRWVGRAALVPPALRLVGARAAADEPQTANDDRQRKLQFAELELPFFIYDDSSQSLWYGGIELDTRVWIVDRPQRVEARFLAIVGWTLQSERRRD
jgi:hypothetical protein